MRLIPTITAFCTAASMSVASPEFWTFEWPNTDFETTTVENWVEIMSGGPPKDGIPAIDDPTFIAVADKPNLTGREPVIALEIEGEIAAWIEIRKCTFPEAVFTVTPP